MNPLRSEVLKFFKLSSSFLTSLLALLPPLLPPNLLSPDGWISRPFRQLSFSSLSNSLRTTVHSTRDVYLPRSPCLALPCDTSSWACFRCPRSLLPLFLSRITLLTGCISLVRIVGL
ncbi:uncharacterized protein BDW47DRAFT_53422 [Aspergillus candidus]|uniref:Uncharacterized protein n=1 Tax=Aspergillus candidus TaxID=41067 RepID=A0A2I2F6F4_ASPCN|nr:hypothetical protein BDW47DRAFT_53422 [Aspergillus candidus]PLB36158.1 hypothetical protein BDW47DRAFT_53422 [Aspergillus candidus]